VPHSALRVCSKPGCSHLVGNGRTCPVHPPRAPFAGRAPARQRYGSGWDAVSRRVRAEHPVCAVCHDEPTVAADHRVPVSEGGQDTYENAQAIGRRCHARKTGQESARSRARRL
jgi:5-methylcytosine-specific restriction endonuclease McrA